MNFKVIKNEKINTSFRAKKVHFIEIQVKDLKSIDNELADKFIRDVLYANFNLDFTNETWKDIKEIIQDKLRKITKYPKGFLKNDGTIIPLIANYALEDVFDISLLSYSEDITDIEIVPKGFDSIFLDKENSIFLCEYKSSIAKLNEEKIANLFIEGYKSIFCKESTIISKISTIKARLNKQEKDIKETIIKNLNKLINQRHSLEKLTEDTDDIKFNICCVTKSTTKIDTNKIVKNIENRFIKEDYCLVRNAEHCKEFEFCNKLENIKVVNIIVIKIPDDFKIENFYESIIENIEDRINE